MTARPPRRHDGRPRRLESRVLRELTRPLGAADQTAAIMRRLGYVPAAPSAARRRRIARRLRPAGLVVLGLAAIASALMLSEAGVPETAPTVPAAVRHELHRQKQGIDATIRTIRNFAPRPARERSVPTDLPDRQIDGSAIAPVRWI